MTDTFNHFVNELQNQIYEEMRAAYGQVAYERWLKPLFVGAIENPDGYGRVTGSCGDTVEIFLRFEHKMVKDARFQTDGCAASMICASFAAELACGKNVEEVAKISGDTILSILGGLPKEDRHCAYLAAATLQEALGNYVDNARWRRNALSSRDDRGTPRTR